MKTGELTKRAKFLRPEKRRDEDGNPVEDYLLAFEVWAHLRPLRGGESVMASRMQSRSPAIITLRRSRQTRSITSEWQVEIDRRLYEIKEDPRETQDRAFLEMLMEAGK